MKKNKEGLAAAKKLMRLLGKKKGLIVLSSVLTAVSVALMLVFPYVIGMAVDVISSSGGADIAELMKKLVPAFCIAVCSAAVLVAVNLLNSRLAVFTESEIRLALYRKIGALPFSVIDKTGEGGIVSRMTADVDRVSDGLMTGFAKLLSSVLTALATLVIMLIINPWVALTVFCLTPLSLFAAKYIAGHTHKYFASRAECNSDMTSKVNESVGNFASLKLTGGEDRANRDFAAINGRLKTAALKAVFFSSLTNPVTRFVNAVIYAFVALTGAYSVISGSAVTVGMLTSLLGYAGQYTKPFNEISGVITELEDALVGLGRITELLDAPGEEDGEEKTVPVSFTGEVEFDNVSFSYDGETQILRNISFKALPGEKIAIVGPTGCGKTTLINLLMRFYDPSEGRILFDGVPSVCIDRASLRKNAGMVLQDTRLTEGATIAENIALGRADASEEEIERAASQALAAPFIRRMPGGFDAVVTSSASIPEGMRQLICIARVMLTDPGLLILDEATSSVDTDTEKRIVSAFARMTEGKTSFIVAHRLTTVKDADRIIVMEDGEIKEQGTYSELANAGGVFSRLLGN